MAFLFQDQNQGIRNDEPRTPRRAVHRNRSLSSGL
jgi:hypothetical protein